MDKKRRQHLVWRCLAIYFILLVLVGALACSCSDGGKNPVPRPVAYPRIPRAYDTTYVCADSRVELEFNRNASVTHKGSGRYAVRYDRYGATLYCSVQTPAGKDAVLSSLQHRMERIALDSGSHTPDFFRSENQKTGVHAVVAYTLRDCPTPLHFVATDSLQWVVAGTVVLDRIEKFGSVAPVIDYLSYDVSHLVKKLKFNKPYSPK